MAVFKKTDAINGKFKHICVAGGVFVDAESGEKVPVAEIIQTYMGDAEFELSVSRKSEEELDGAE